LTSSLVDAYVIIVT